MNIGDLLDALECIGIATDAVGAVTIASGGSGMVGAGESGGVFPPFTELFALPAGLVLLGNAGVEDEGATEDEKSINVLESGRSQQWLNISGMEARSAGSSFSIRRTRSCQSTQTDK